MNKRQRKKRLKTIKQRVEFFNKHTIISGARRNGKANFYKCMLKACYGKSYKLFKNLKKTYKNLFLAIDWSTGKDYSAMTTFKIQNKITRIIKTEIIDEDDGLEGLAPHTWVIDEYHKNRHYKKGID